MILIVDGDQVAGSALERLIRYRGYDAIAVQSGTEALSFLELRKPDGVILSLTVDDIDGVTLLKAIKLDAALADVPVIIYTAEFGDERRRQMLDAGALDYVVKGSIGSKSLIKRIERFFPRSGN